MRSDGCGPGADVDGRPLDLADLARCATFAERVAGRARPLDLLINNAGVMAPPRRLTADGFESQFGTNHLGHFALTGLLLARCSAAPAPRVVTVVQPPRTASGGSTSTTSMASAATATGCAYGQSKLANLMFCFELHRRAVAAGTR